MRHLPKPKFWFEEAAALLRTRYNGESELSASTERRLMELATRRKRKPWAILLVPAVIVGTGSLAWAKEFEQAWQWTVTHVREVFESTSPDSAPATPQQTLTTRAGSKPPAHLTHTHETQPVPAELIVPTSTEPQGTEPMATASLLSQPTSTATPTALPTTSATRPSSSVSPNTTKPDPRRAGDIEATTPDAPQSSAPTDFERYRAGYIAQFERRDDEAALSAWDDYLKNVPGGRFAPEVRYNRALVLIRLGLTREAELALKPFAAGAYGPLRQESAARLLEQLQERPEVATP